MTLRARLFPEERHPELVQTEWCADWFDTLAGLGYLTAFVTERKQQLHSLIDQVGPAVVYLQRHRIEIGLKTLLDQCGVDVPPTHDLMALWAACERSLEAAHRDLWRDFSGDHAELVLLLDEADPRGASFRYPVDTSGQAVERPQFIDLEVLEEAADAFESGVVGVMSVLEAVAPPREE